MTAEPILDALLKSAYQSARKVILGGQEAIPVFLAQWGDGQVCVYGTVFRDDREKDMIAQVIKILFAARQVRRYVFVSEAWMVKLPKEAVNLSEEDLPRASTHPDRIEVLNLIGVEGGRVVGAHALLGRDGDGKRTCGALIMADADTKLGGRFAELLPDPDTPALPPAAAEMLETTFGLIPTPTTIH